MNRSRYAADMPFFGLNVMAGSVLHISAEDRRETFHRHVYTNSRGLTDLQLALIAERLHVKDCVGFGFKLTWSVDGRTLIADDVGQMIEYAKANSPLPESITAREVATAAAFLSSV